jgi:hypothetical protein
MFNTMPNFEKHGPLLSSLVNSKSSQVKSIILSCSDEEIKFLIELVLNFDLLNKQKCSKKYIKDLRFLQRVRWKISTARKVFVRNFIKLKPLIALCIITIIELEVCDII